MLSKKTCTIIWELNQYYDFLWRQWQKSWWDDSYVKKMKIVRAITINLEKQQRGLLKSSLDYFSSGSFLIENKNLSYSEQHSWVTEILLWKIYKDL